jgi:sugar transferase EpsL
MNRTSQTAKRAFDLVVALVGLLFLSPLLAIIAGAIYATMGSPVHFRQQRPGLHGKPFAILKFRTMTNTRDADGNLLPAEERVTLLGQFLRRTSLDELPELFNVLQGDMSLVGPRPLLMQYLELYTPEQMRRHDVKPGISGWAQVNGRNTISWEEKFALDVWYVDNQSIGLDLKILLMTVWKVLRREAVDKAGYVGQEYFTGSHQQMQE